MFSQGADRDTTNAAFLALVAAKYEENAATRNRWRCARANFPPAPLYSACPELSTNPLEARLNGEHVGAAAGSAHAVSPAQFPPHHRTTTKPRHTLAPPCPQMRTAPRRRWAQSQLDFMLGGSD